MDIHFLEKADRVASQDSKRKQASKGTHFREYKEGGMIHKSEIK
jgi:hypothetical protein